jgi:hypothetical protein
VSRQHRKAENGGDERAAEHTDLGLLDQFRVVRESQRADEQAHREADPAQDAGTPDLRPARALGAGREPEPLRDDYGQEDARLFAEYQPCGDRQRERREQRALGKVAQRHAGVREAEQRDDQVEVPAAQRVLEAARAVDRRRVIGSAPSALRSRPRRSRESPS